MDAMAVVAARNLKSTPRTTKRNYDEPVVRSTVFVMCPKIKFYK